MLDEIDDLMVVVEDDSTSEQGEVLGYYEGLAERGDYSVPRVELGGPFASRFMMVLPGEEGAPEI